jgi:hypothetical protein
MGQPINQGSQGATEVWAYESGNGRVTTNATYNRFGASAVSVGRFYHINIVMSNGRVLAVNNTGPTGGGLTAGEQCAYAVENCTQPR